VQTAGRGGHVHYHLHNNNTNSFSYLMQSIFKYCDIQKNTSLTPDKEPNILIERLPVSLYTQELCTFKNGLFLAHPVEDF